MVAVVAIKSASKKSLNIKRKEKRSKKGRGFSLPVCWLFAVAFASAVIAGVPECTFKQ